MRSILKTSTWDSGRAFDGRRLATGKQDPRFQDIMAASTGLTRVPAMFFSLTVQLRRFVAVFGLTYAYSIPQLCEHNSALFRYIADRNGAEAGEPLELQDERRHDVHAPAARPISAR